MTRAQLVGKLLRTCHLNVPERRQLVPPDIHFSEILAVIRDAVEREGLFSSGYLTLEQLDGGAYRLHYLNYDPRASDLVNDMGGPGIPATADYQTAYAAVMAAARSSLPLWPSPTAHFTDVPLPTLSLKSELTLAR
jgi:hypothetical protein